MTTNAYNALPDFDASLITAAQDVVEQIRIDLKGFPFSSSLDSEEWRNSLPAPLNSMSNYPALRSMMRYQATNKFWLTVSTIYGVPFMVFDQYRNLTASEVRLIKNDFPDLINNLNPFLISGRTLNYEGRQTWIINNIEPRLINNIEPDYLVNITPPPGINSRFYYVYVFYPDFLANYEQAQIGLIREDIRKIVEFFMPAQREVSEILNLFPV